MNINTLISIYIIFFYFFGAITFICVFGYNFALTISKTFLNVHFFSSPQIFLSATLASIIMIKIMKNRLLLTPYPYFMLGFYVGNLSLVLIFTSTYLMDKHLDWTLELLHNHKN